MKSRLLHIIRNPNPWRRQIIELKLKIAIGSLFPFFVVGSKQFADIPAETNLTVVDGIIGEVLANKAAKSDIDNFSVEDLFMSEEDFNNLPPSDQHEIIQDWVMGIEIDKEFKYNPIIRRRWNLQRELDTESYKVEYLAYPEFKAGDIEGFKAIILHGDRVTFHTQDLGDISGEIWLPNYEVPGYSGWGLTEEIAALFALERIKLMRENREKRAK